MMNNNILNIEDNQTLSFGDFSLNKKTKVDNFEFQGDLYKVKTFEEITKLEKNGMFIYESLPGTRVTEFSANEKKMSFRLEGTKVTQITVGLEEQQLYHVVIDGKSNGEVKTNVSGKLSLSVDLSNGNPIEIKIVKSI